MTIIGNNNQSLAYAHIYMRPMAHEKWNSVHVIRNTAHRPSTRVSYTASRVRPKQRKSNNTYHIPSTASSCTSHRQLDANVITCTGWICMSYACHMHVICMSYACHMHVICMSYAHSAWSWETRYLFVQLWMVWIKWICTRKLFQKHNCFKTIIKLWTIARQT